MKNYKELFDLNVCFYCNWYRTIEDESYCSHQEADKYQAIAPTGTCDNWIEEHFGN